MKYREIVQELLACTSVNALVDILLAYATEVYEVGFAAGSADYAQA